MPELTIHVPGYIGPSYLEESEDGWFCEWVQGITKADVEMQIEWAKMLGEPADSILLEISTCDGGSTIEGFAIYNYLRSLGLPIRTRILALAASMAVPLALAADEAPEMDYTAQLMLHSATFNGGVYAETSKDLRAQADRLDNTNQLLTDLLIARTGQAPEVVAEWMSKDTWLTATQAQAVGLCSKVNPLAPKLTPVEADTVITARRKRTTATMARASHRATLTATHAAPTPAPISVPMATSATKPTPRAAAPAAKAPAARKTLFTKLLNALGIDEDGNEVADETTALAADVQRTAVTDGTLYHDGPLAVDAVVYTDEDLTETAAAGEYDTTDGQTITVGDAGVVTALAPVADALVDTSTAALARRLDRLEANERTSQETIASLTADNERLRKLKPALPQARTARPNADAPDPKTLAAPKAQAAHHAQL